MSRPDKKKKNDPEVRAAFGLVAQIGVGMGMCVFLGFLGGKYLDGLLGTSPVFLLLGCFLGMGASFKTLYDLIKKWMK